MDTQNLFTNDGDANANNLAAPTADNTQLGDANNELATPNSTFGDAKDDLATPNDQVGVAGDAKSPSSDVTAAIEGKITYTLTIEEAQQRIAAAHRKVPSRRSMSRYCQESKLLGIQVSVTRSDGTHGQPYFINEESLDNFIQSQPRVVLGDAGEANDNELATPTAESPQFGDAKDDLATPNDQVGVAGDAKIDIQDKLASPFTGVGEANDTLATPEIKPVPSEVNRNTAAEQPIAKTKTISLQDLLIENAKLETRLETQIEGKDELIEQLKNERGYLRTEVQETRETMLRTVEAITAAGVLPAGKSKADNITNVLVSGQQDKRGISFEEQ